MKKSILALLAALLTLSGCARTGSVYTAVRDVAELQLVQTLGFDRGERGRILLSASSGAGSEEVPAARLAGEGRSIQEAVRDLQDWSAREELFFAHVQCVVMGEDAARQGIGELLDWVERSPQIRLDLPLFLAEDGTARELVTGSDDEEYEATAILLALQRDAEHGGEAFCYTLSEIATRLARSGCALCCSVRAADPSEAAPSSEDALTALETGFAVLRDGKLLGFTGKDAARGICLLQNKAGSGLVLLPDGTGKLATVVLSGGGAELTPRWDAGGRPWLEVRLRYRAGLVETRDTPEAAEDYLPALNAALSAWLDARAREALGLSLAMETDYLELGRLFQRSDPVHYSVLDWKAEFPSLRCSIDAEGVVERSYDIGASARTRGDGLGHA